MGLRILLIDPNEKVIPSINIREKSPKPNKKRKKKYTDEERLERDKESKRKCALISVKRLLAHENILALTVIIFILGAFLGICAICVFVRKLFADGDSLSGFSPFLAKKLARGQFNQENRFGNCNSILVKMEN